MGLKHLSRSLVPQSSGASAPKYIDKDVASISGIDEDGNDKNVFVSLKYIQKDYQCFSDWSKQEMTSYWSFNGTIHSMTWQMIYSQGGKKDKRGLGYTELPHKIYPSKSFRDRLSPEVALFELRVSEKARVHGFRMKSVFFLCWLDKDHAITGN